MKKEDYKNKIHPGVSDYFEILFRLLSEFTWHVMRGLTILIGLSFITVGGIIL